MGPVLAPFSPCVGPRQQLAAGGTQGPEAKSVLDFNWSKHTDLYLPPYFEALALHARLLFMSRS